jgi:alanyl-tRNA synthetase
VQAVAAALKAPQADIVTRIEGLMDDRRKLERELAEAKKALALSGGAKASGGDGIAEINGVKLLVIKTEGLENNALKGLVDEGKTRVGSGVVAVANTSADGRAALIVGVTADLTSRFNAVDLVRAGSAVLGGKGGGGRPDMAQAGGPDAAKTDEALAAIKGVLAG